jgi:hypothetical protein
MGICVYALICPQTGMPRYIGKANDASRRLHSHIRDAKRRHGPVQKWICELMAEGLRPSIQILADDLTSENWRGVEKALIEEARNILGREYLLNLADGGNEPPNAKTEEQRRQTALKVVRARTRSPEMARFYSLKRDIGHMLRRGELTRAAKDKLLICVAQHPELFPETWQAQLSQ